MNVAVPLQASRALSAFRRYWGSWHGPCVELQKRLTCLVSQARFVGMMNGSKWLDQTSGSQVCAAVSRRVSCSLLAGQSLLAVDH